MCTLNGEPLNRKEPIMSDTKRCSKCKLHKPLSEYGKDKNSKDGLYHYCKTCRNALRRQAYTPRHPDRITKAMKDATFGECSVPEGAKRCSTEFCRRVFPDTKEYFREGRNTCRECERILANGGKVAKKAVKAEAEKEAPPNAKKFHGTDEWGCDWWLTTDGELVTKHDEFGWCTQKYIDEHDVLAMWAG
jgi:hypothetical protein